jgi:transketolase
MSTSFIEKHVDRSQKPKASRQSFGEALEAWGAKNPRIVALDADLSKSTQTQYFAAKFPDRFFNMGIAEANMIGTAAGLAQAGFVPFAASFACFLTGRYDQIRMSVAASCVNVRLVGTHAGVGIGEDGHSQMGLEDLALMRSLPNMTVFQPGDDADTRDFIEWSLEHQGPVYMRLTRQGLPHLRRASKRTFTPGRWDVFGEESLMNADVIVMASGGLLTAALEACTELEARGLKPVAVNANWIKPIDEAFLRKVTGIKAKLLVTAEDHYAVGGLGGAVAEFLSSQGCATPLLRIGVHEAGQSGSPEANYEHYGFTGPKIAARILKEIG